MPYLKKIENDQYVFSDKSSWSNVILDDSIEDGWVPGKYGQSIENVVEGKTGRVNEQDNSAVSADLITMVTNRCDSDDIHLDFKLRAWLCRKYPQFFKVWDCKKKRHEWLLYNANNIYASLGIKMSRDDLDNNKFNEMFKKQVYKYKEEAIRALTGKESSAPLILRPHQQEIVDNFPMPSEKKYIVAFLACRTGKTLIALAHGNNVVKEYINLVVIAASKNLSSNESFEDEYKKYKKYFKFPLLRISLHKNPEKMIATIRKSIPADSTILLITDEADRESCTMESIDRLEYIKSEFTVIQHLIMSGTAIYKANPITRGMTEDEIYRFALNYTDYGLFYKDKMYTPCIHRGFFNIIFKMSHNKVQLNVRESFADSERYDELAKTIHYFATTPRLRPPGYGVDGLAERAVMFFIATGVDELNKFAVVLGEKYKDTHEVIAFNGKSRVGSKKVTNKTAELLTLNRLEEMANDPLRRDKQLIILSISIGERSYSVSAISRAFVVQDGETNHTITQKLHRSTTVEDGKTHATLCRIGFISSSLSADIFVLENEGINSMARDEVLKRGDKLWGSGINSFATYTIDNGVGGDWSTPYDKETRDDWIDRVFSIDANVKSMVARLFHLYDLIEIDVEPVVNKKVLTKSTPNSNSTPKSKTNKGTVDPIDKESKKQLTMEAYMAFVHIAPMVAKTIYDIDNLEDFINIGNDEWKQGMSTGQAAFKRNLEIKEFKHEVLLAFRTYKDEDRKEYIEDLFQMFK